MSFSIPYSEVGGKVGESSILNGICTSGKHAQKVNDEDT
jgi:hypothetical protein